MKVKDQKVHDRIGKAIVRAHQTAGKDDAAFLDALRAKAAPPVARSGVRGLSLGTAPKTPRGARLASDPRYLANVRKLVTQKSNARIVGGSDVEGKEFDDCVAVGSPAQFGCTGTLIAPNAVLTAAHCESLHTRIFIGNRLTKKGREIQVKTHVRHERFDAAFNHDLMILILEKNVTGVTPRGRASKGQIEAATTARVVGFGTTDVEATQGFGVKRKTDVPIVSQGCRGTVNGKSDETVYGCHQDREIVAGKPLFLHDTCKGDSGGPFFVQDTKGQWLLAGVTSRGTDLATTMCGDGGVYVRVDAYQDWIDAVLARA